MIPLYLSDAFFPFPLNRLSRLTKDLTVGRMLKGGGRVEPASKKLIHSFVLANFHSLEQALAVVETRQLCFTIRASN